MVVVCYAKVLFTLCIRLVGIYIQDVMCKYTNTGV